MPELPEVETVRVGLESLIAGATVTDVSIRRDSCIRVFPGDALQFADSLRGLTLAEVARRGKFLWLPLAHSDGEPSGWGLSAHLGMSGQFRVHEDLLTVAHPHCRARLTVSVRGTSLLVDFLDQRTFGYLNMEPLLAVADDGPGGAGTRLAAVPASVAHIGRDALDPAVTPERAAQLWRKGRRGIKQVLLDQTLISGIGNIYADEALWLARIHPERPAAALTARQARTLFRAAREVMAGALSQGGTSFDALYVNVNGESGYFSRSLNAYGRGGEPCGRCGRPLRREAIGGRSSHWCTWCQRVYTPRAPTPVDDGTGNIGSWLTSE